MPLEDRPIDDTLYQRRSRRQRILDWLAFLRSALVSLVVIVAVVGLVTLSIIDLSREPIIIETIGSPPELANKGYTGSVMADRLWESIRDVQSRSGTRKSHTRLLAESRQLDVVEPASGISLQLVTRSLRSLFGLKQTQIVGEFICEDRDCTIADASLRLRILSGSEMMVVSPGPIGDMSVDDYLHRAALQALEQIDPYVHAAHLMRAPETRTRAVEIAKALVIEDDPASPWAANLLGNHSQSDMSVPSESRHRLAELWYEIAIDKAKRHGPPNFAHPVANWGGSLRDRGDHAGAIEKYEEAVRLDPDFAEAYSNWGFSLTQLGRRDEALAKFRRAVGIDPALTIAWDNWALTLQKMANGLGEAPGEQQCAFARGPLDGYLRVAEHRATTRLQQAATAFLQSCPAAG